MILLILKWSKKAIELDFATIEKQLELLRQNSAYTNQLLLEKLSYLEKEIEDIENWLDKQDSLSYVKRRRP